MARMMDSGELSVVLRGVNNVCTSQSDLPSSIRNLVSLSAKSPEAVSVTDFFGRTAMMAHGSFLYSR